MDGTAFGDAVVVKVRWRVWPVLIVDFFNAFLDRVNVGFATLQMDETSAFVSQAGSRQAAGIAA